CACSFCELQVALATCEKFGDLFLCRECGEFGDQSGFELKALASMKPKSPAKWKERKAQKEEWAKGKAVAEDDREFPQEEVYEETIQDSSLSEECTFQSRDDFKEEHGCLPDQAKVMTLRVTNSKGEESFGAVLATETDAPPKLTAGNLFENMSADRSRARGQKFGNKYQPKAKKFSAYKKDAIKQLVKRNVESSRTKEKRTSEKASPTLALAPSSKKAKPGTNVAPSIADTAATGVDGEGGRLKPPEHWHETITPSRVFAGAPLKRHVGWARDCVKRIAGQGESVKANHLTEHIDAIDLCMELMTELANEKVTFVSLSTILGKLVTKKVDFDSNIKSKLLGKRLFSSILAFSSGDTDDACIKEIVDTVMPFTVEKLDASQEVTCDDDGDEKMAPDPEEFDPMKVSMATIDGSSDSRMTLLLSVLLKEIVPAVMQVDQAGQVAASRLCAAMLSRFEAGVAEMEEIPSAASDTLAVLRVMCALSDSTADMDFDALDEFFLQQAKKTKGALADLGVMIRLNEHWKEIYEELQTTIQDAREWMPKIFKSAAQVKALKTSEAPISLPSAIIDEAFDILKSCRTILRAGSTHTLEIEIAGVLGVIQSKMFDKSGVVNGGDGYSKAELLAADKMFKDSLDLKCWVEEFGIGAREHIGAVIEKAGAKEIMNGLKEMMMGGAKDEAGNIDIEKVRAVKVALHNLTESSLDVEGKEAVASFCSRVWDAIKDAVNASNGEIAGVMKDIALVAGDGITDIFKAFHAAGETKFSIAAHVS
ncbi:unnamed protein product, partial [Prorocentrum cordatum]